MRNKIVSRLTVASLIGVGVVALAFACDNTTPAPTPPADMTVKPADLTEIPDLTMFNPPVVTSVAPSNGINNATTNITITGTDFRAGATVTVGGTACANVVVVSPTSITCTVAAKATTCASEDIVVTHPDDGKMGTGAKLFTYRTSAVGWATGSPVNYPTGAFPRRVIVADFNGDGKLDLASANQVGNNVTLKLGAGNGTFPVAGSVNIPNGGGATTLNNLVAGDWNGDTKLDLAVVNGTNNATIFLNMGASFTTTVVNTGISGGSIAAGDVNGDNKLDLIVGGNSTNVVPLIGNGTGGFAMGTLRAAPGTNVGVALADMNADGKLDLITANQSTNNASIYIGNGAGTFGNPTSVAVGTAPTSVVIRDVNGDKKMDVVVGNNVSMNTSVLIGNGAGGMAAAVNQTLGTNRPETIAVADINNDGWFDIVTSNAPQNNWSYLQASGATGTQYAPQVATASGTTPAGVAVADLNGDGLQDVVIASAGSNNVQVSLQVCK